MTSLLSSISGQFGKSIILGTFFPVLMVSILTEILVTPILTNGPALQAQLSKIAIGEEKWATVSLAFVVSVITGILYNLNIPIIRLYEGYPWKDSYLGRMFSYRKLKTFSVVIPLRISIRSLRRQIDKLQTASDLSKTLQAEQTALALYINSELPDKLELVLPTRLGNVIRSFERYPAVAYGMDAIVLWPRLVAKIDGSFATTVDETKTSLDFMLNCSFLCAVVAVSIAFLGTLTRMPAKIHTPTDWIWRSALFFALSRIFYSFSIGRAMAWGTQVKAAFDLYRLDLLKSLGYQQQFLTYSDEKTFWQRLSTQLLYADSRESPLLYRDPPTRMIMTPFGAELKLNRTVSAASVAGGLYVALTFENKSGITARGVVVTETPPDGFKPILGGVRCSRGVVTVSNLAPFQMLIDDVPPGATVTVSYVARPS